MATWPAKVPVLTADDISLLYCTDPEDGDKHNLFGWVLEVFGHWMYEPGKTAHRKCEKVLPFFTPIGTETGGCYGDDILPRVTETEMATAFNRLTARLGYVVGNPEARKKK